MSMRAADDFEVIRIRLDEIRADRMKASKRCIHCDEALGQVHRTGCRFNSTVIESETKPD